FPRFAHRLPFELQWDDQAVRGETSLLSEREATVSAQLFPARCPEKAVLCLPSLELVDLPVRLRQDTGGQLSLEFLQLSLPQRRALVRYLYCRPGQWETPPKSEARAVW